MYQPEDNIWFSNKIKPSPRQNLEKIFKPMQNPSLTTSEHRDYQGHLIPDQKNPLVHQAQSGVWNSRTGIGVADQSSVFNYFSFTVLEIIGCFTRHLLLITNLSVFNLPEPFYLGRYISVTIIWYQYFFHFICSKELLSKDDFKE